MDRPASRGLVAGGVQKAPTGQGFVPERPSSAARQPAAAGFMAPATPSSSGPSMMGPVGMRGGTAQGGPPSTAYKRVTAAGAPMQQALQAQARPLTQQGMGGSKPLTQAAGRQVLDRTYFINELRQKRQQIINITARMREELEVLAQKKAAAVRAEKTAGQLRKDVRLLQEALADNNIIIDKAGSHTPLQHIHAEYAEIRGRNEAQQARVEDILSQRLALEQRTKQVDGQIAAIQSTLDRRLSSMPPSARQAHSELLVEQATLLTEAGQFEERLAELRGALSAAEGELGRNTFKQRALELQEQLKLLTERKYELAAAEEAAKASPEEQREALMARVKRDNAAVECATSEAKQLQEEVRQLEAAVAAAGSAAAGGGLKSGGALLPPDIDEQGRREKFEELKAKEKELNAFLDAFPQRKAAKAAELAAKQEAVAAGLERMSKLQALTDAAALPSQGQFQQMKDELDYKQQQLDSAAATGEALKAELAARKDELEKIDTLGGKIDSELEALRGRLVGMQQELAMYGAVQAAKAAKEAARGQLETEKAQLSGRQDAVQADLADQSWQQQAKEAQLKENAAWPAIDRLEQQQQQLKQQIDTAQQFIREHEEKADYRPLKQQLEGLVDDVNSCTISLLSAA
ncbi:intraflagellar transport protein IFT-71/74 [Scenedesmus sp. NREL 46B-D3]|nr:intraflagellar transport protein IFT-71/74 [Scenedesmus sp. NREL 46B-D3]